METGSTVTVEIGAERHTVPAGITLIQALWAMGKTPVHGIGCLGGVCGACAVGYRISGRMQSETGLACQTLVQEGMSVSFFPSDSSEKAIYSIPDVPPDKAALFASYPGTRRCTSCRACTTVCPQGIDVMGAVRAAINGEMDTVADKFTSCVMCGLCAVVCDVRIVPHRVGVWARRMHGAFYPQQALQLLHRIDDVKQGRYREEWGRIFEMNDAELLRTPP